MKCNNCGKEIANDSQFCEYCGAKINTTDDCSSKNPKVKWPQLILGILGVVIGGYFMLRSSGTIGLIMLIVIAGIIGVVAYKSGKSNK